jgi:hypothetical protein
MNFTASKPIENSPPTAPIAPDNPLGTPTPIDHRSGPLTAISAGSFQNRHGRHGRQPANVVRQCDSGTVHQVHGHSSQRLNRLDALCHTNGTQRVTFGG